MINHIPFVYFCRRASVDSQGLDSVQLLFDLALAFKGWRLLGYLIPHLRFNAVGIQVDFRIKYGLLLSHAAH